MRGTMTEREPGVWRLRVYVGRDGNGRPIQSSSTFRGGKRKAEDALRAFVAEVERTRSPQRDATLAQLLDRWMEHIKGERTPQTWHGYRLKIDARIKPKLGTYRIDRLGPEPLDRQYRAWLAEGLAPATVRQYHAIVSAALSQAVKWGWIDRNPAARATPPQIRHRATTTLTSADLRTMLKAAEERQDEILATAIALAALTGARRGELCGLRWSDVAGDVLSISRAISTVAGTITEGDTKTHQARRLALDPVALEVLGRRRRAQEKLAADAGSELVADPYILSRRADGAAPALPNGITLAFGRLARHLKLPYHFHDLRHFAATTAITAGVDVRTVASRLGHADPSVTLRIYAHAVETADQAAAAVLGLALTAPIPPASADTPKEITDGS